MILLDTNVLSALMLRDPDARVVGWLDGQAPESIWTTSVTVFEIRFGIEVLANGRQRRRLEEVFSKALEEEFENRVLPFDRNAAQAAAAIAAHQRRHGMPIEIRDVQIAGIASVCKATLATRNTRHFQSLGIQLVDPWKGH